MPEMQLFYSATSPFVRKVLVLAHEAGLAARLQLLPVHSTPVQRHEELARRNPLGKIPALLLREGAQETILFDSRVIAEYLDGQHRGKPFFPASGKARFRALTLQALGDGILDAAVLARYEVALRPAERQWPDWQQGQMTKIFAALQELERVWLDDLRSEPLHIGQIACACALGYLDFRFAATPWRAQQPRLAQLVQLAAWFDAFAQRDSMLRTAPPQS